MTAVEAFCQFYQRLDHASVAHLANIYANNVVFVDPVTKHEGIEALTGYFENLLANTASCSFEIKKVSQAQDTSFVQWIMHFQHPKLAANSLISVHGLTELRVEQNKVVYHRDYYDMGEMIYEHIPLLGRIIRWLKQRLAQ